MDLGPRLHGDNTGAETAPEAEDRDLMEPRIDTSETTHFGYRQVPRDEKVEWVRRHFNTVSGYYDIMNTVLSFGIHYLWKRTAIKMMGLSPGDRVLDVCGGTGDLAIMALKAVGNDGQVVLYDINREMMGAGRAKRTNAAFRKRIDYVEGDAERIAFPDNHFDAAMVGFGIRNLTEPENGFREMHRVLKPGGVFMCLEFSVPVWPVFKWLYDFYSFTIMPWLGEALVGSRQAYTYLPESIRLWPMPPELAATLTDIGFEDMTYRLLTNGIAVAHVGKKIIATT
jgi:demethylmenaquinone methyltransferase / 2-methoxy-6-polyprenyl-1,4-benzoquinol methylase